LKDVSSLTNEIAIKINMKLRREKTLPKILISIPLKKIATPLQN
jgi:hypothetical protein